MYYYKMYVDLAKKSFFRVRYILILILILILASPYFGGGTTPWLALQSVHAYKDIDLGPEV